MQKRQKSIAGACNDGKGKTTEKWSKINQSDNEMGYVLGGKGTQGKEKKENETMRKEKREEKRVFSSLLKGIASLRSLISQLV